MPEHTVITPSGNADPPAGEAFLRVVRGQPTPEEIAALVMALLVQDSEAAAPAVRKPRAAWGDPARVLRSRHHGPGVGGHPLPHA